MQVVNTHCAGLDVHKKTVVARVVTPKNKATRTFGTTTKQLLALADWLQDLDVTIVAMESTGVYWKPVWNLLEGTDCQLLLVNAHQIKQVPGRKRTSKMPSGSRNFCATDS